MPVPAQSSVQGRAVSDFLGTATIEPAALVVEGEAGIGKTTLWLSTVQQARERGFRVLSARASAAESVLAYASLGDLLGGVNDDTWARLPAPQRLAIDRVLLRAQPAGGATDWHAVAAAFLSIVKGLADETPVLLAIDDVQWLDSSSRQVVAFAARRLAGAVGVLGTERTDPDGGDGASWLQLPEPDAVARIAVAPLSVGALHTVLRERFGRSFSRPVMVRIRAVSGGNPFYALELARAIDSAPVGDGARDMLLSGTLAALMRARIGSLGSGVHEALLAVACLAEPTVNLVVRATGADAAVVVTLLEAAESAGIIGFEGSRLRFTHPLLARGVYTEASPAHRRAMHRRLAGIVDQPELAARHLALAATSADPHTVAALDAAAKSARDRGAPATAAELVELAIGLGGDTPKRRIRLAGYLFHAGDLVRARRMIEDIIEALEPSMLRAGVWYLLAAVRLSDDSFVESCAALQHALGEVGDNLALRVEMLGMLSWVQVHAGHPEAAAANVADAVSAAQQLGVPRLLSQALSLRAFVGFLRGEGLDEPALRYALETDDHHAGVTVAYWPSMQNAQLTGWAGQLDHARHQMASIWERCRAQGRESELDYVAFYFALIEIWRGDFTAATVIATDAVDRALQLDSNLSLAAALTVRAIVAAYTGRVDEARADAATAREASRRGGAPLMATWSSAAAGFVEVSLGRYDAALIALTPVLPALDAAPEATEIFVASFIPDAAEALIGLGRLDDAEPLIGMLQRNGARLDRAWMLAIGARCRAMLWAARGDLDAANLAVGQAMAHHERLPMPFERARTQLLVGQLQRRQRQKNAAAAALREALATFEELGTPLWALRASTELARTQSTAAKSGVLTPSEHRVAELTATGMTNRDVAAALFITPKTVEANLVRIYRKLGIRSRAELGRHMHQPES